MTKAQRVELKYGDGELFVVIPDKNLMGILSPQEAKALEDPMGEVWKALECPIGSDNLRNLISSSQRVVILASDISRPVPSSLLLPPILEELYAAGIRDEQVRIVFGLGVHRRHTEEEKEQLVGSEVYKRVECIDHDIEQCKPVGVTSRGNRAAVFQDVLEADFIIATGNLEFHYFAGFSGGAKALAPGVCSRDTIEANHRLLLDPCSRGGLIQGNPLREELEEIAAMVGVDFLVNAVLNSHKRIVKIVAGDVTESHRQGAEYINRFYRVEINNPADIVITCPGGFPKDINLYQSHKAMQNALLAVRKGGIIIAVAQCREGYGEKHFAQAFQDRRSLQAYMDELKSGFVQGRHIVSQMAKIQLHHKIYLVSDLPPEVRNTVFVDCFDSVNDALVHALNELGEEAQVLVMPQGTSTLPFLG